MIDLYFAPTPNGWKAAIALEEMGLEYRLIPVSLRDNDQRAPGFLALSPGGKIPALTDDSGGGEPVTIFESGAILWYLAGKTGHLIPAEAGPCREVLQWLFWQTGFQGPMAGQHSHFWNYAPEVEKDGYAAQRYRDQYLLSLDVLERRLSAREWIVGDAYSIADIQCFPWAFIAKPMGVPLDPYPRVADWRARIKDRPAVQKAIGLGR